ncbi:hypothetical protein BCR35DRAFT_332667 [Leucosporidium creatinivorum]|uniref:Uncharacterized protein n=1 Tax=Leucosporidium creatinivorum TaxID=106004 RepID=A0A1Y2F1L3_9BASI|nr:hypothetical protein BCR35DRAFT_332667 [Leucosporidium creatinivorum]
MQSPSPPSPSSPHQAQGLPDILRPASAVGPPSPRYTVDYTGLEMQERTSIPSRTNSYSPLPDQSTSTENPPLVSTFSHSSTLKDDPLSSKSALLPTSNDVDLGERWALTRPQRIWRYTQGVFIFLTIGLVIAGVVVGIEAIEGSIDSATAARQSSVASVSSASVVSVESVSSVSAGEVSSSSAASVASVSSASAKAASSAATVSSTASSSASSSSSAGTTTSVATSTTSTTSSTTSAAARRRAKRRLVLE